MRRGERKPIRRPPRQLHSRVLVVAEGTATEPQYVERLISWLRTRGVTVQVKTVGVGKDPLRVVEKALSIRKQAYSTEKEYHSCVCLVDVDSHSNLAEACALAEREGIEVLVSNPKFEIWLRWHVDEGRSALSSKQLNDLVAKKDLVQGKRLAPGFPVEEVDQACDRARRADPEMQPCRIGPNPSTALPLLVDILRGLPA